VLYDRGQENENGKNIIYFCQRSVVNTYGSTKKLSVASIQLAPNSFMI